MSYRGESRAPGVGTGVGTGTRKERKVEGKESLGTWEVIKEVIEVIEVGRKTRERGWGDTNE